jgi:hypothetical protein
VGDRPFIATDAAVADPKEMEIELDYFTWNETEEKTLSSFQASYSTTGFIWNPPLSNVSIDAGIRRCITRAAPAWMFTTGLTFGIF